MGDVNILFFVGNICLYGEDGLVYFDLCLLIIVIYELKLYVDVIVCLNRNKYILYVLCNE